MSDYIHTTALGFHRCYYALGTFEHIVARYYSGHPKLNTTPMDKLIGSVLHYDRALKRFTRGVKKHKYSQPNWQNAFHAQANACTQRMEQLSQTLYALPDIVSINERIYKLIHTDELNKTEVWESVEELLPDQNLCAYQLARIQALYYERTSKYIRGLRGATQGLSACSTDLYKLGRDIAAHMLNPQSVGGIESRLRECRSRMYLFFQKVDKCRFPPIWKNAIALQIKRCRAKLDQQSQKVIFLRVVLGNAQAIAARVPAQEILNSPYLIGPQLLQIVTHCKS